MTALVLLEWTVGWIAGAAWSQSWDVIRRGHFRITAWGSLLLGVLAGFAVFAALQSLADVSTTEAMIVAGGVLLLAYVAV